MNIAGLIILRPWYQIGWIFRFSKWYALKEESKNQTRAFAMRIVDKKLAEYEQNAKNGAVNNNSNTVHNDDDDDDIGRTKRAQNNFIDECVRLAVEEQCFSRVDMVNESLTMLLGGFETTAITASYIVLMLAMHPELQERVFEEVRTIAPEQLGDVTAEQIGQLDYTNRFIKETMRLMPTVPFISRIAKQDFEISEFFETHRP